MAIIIDFLFFTPWLITPPMITPLILIASAIYSDAAMMPLPPPTFQPPRRHAASATLRIAELPQAGDTPAAIY